MKFIVVTGGIISGIGKGITASSIGLILQDAGYTVTSIKIDPYLNLDAGTMSPFEHGECYVLDDGSECDLDLGNYERFLDIDLTRHHNVTTGQIYNTVLQKERRGEYLGKTVQVVPHICDEIINRITYASRLLINNKIPDICIIEIGGTIGDIEVVPFIESIRQMQVSELDTFCFVHVTMALIVGLETKTKPIQHSVSEIRKLGINPDILVVRTPNLLDVDSITKLKTFCQVSTIISNTDVMNIYFVPDNFVKQNIYLSLSNKLGLKHPLELNKVYYNILNYYLNPPTSSVTIGIVGKYVGMNDTYLSLIRAIEHASFYVNKKYNIKWIDSENIVFSELDEVDRFIIPGGFGSRGVEGKLNVLEYARENELPVLGICLGMQLMVIDVWNSVWSMFESSTKGGSTEFDKDVPCKLIDIIEDNNMLGGTMRLGSYTCNLKAGSKVANLYNSLVCHERHRHRYEVNNKYIDELERCGLNFVGTCDSKYQEIVELNNHPFYIGCQFHPEYKSRYNKPHPLFVGLLMA